MSARNKNERPVNVSELIKLAQATFAEVAAYADSTDESRKNTAGCLHLRWDNQHTLKPDLLDRLLVGDLKHPKINKYIEFASREKPGRLIQHRDHKLSRESRDPENGKYSGAVRLSSGLIIAFSGLPEEIDEAYVMALSVVTGLETLSNALDRMHEAGNKHFHSVHQIIMQIAVDIAA